MNFEKREKVLLGINCCLPEQYGGGGCNDCPYCEVDEVGEPGCASSVLLPVRIIDDMREVLQEDLTDPEEERLVNPVRAAATLVKLIALIGALVLLLIAIVCTGLSMVSWLLRSIFGG